MHFFLTSCALYLSAVLGDMDFLFDKFVMVVFLYTVIFLHFVVDIHYLSFVKFEDIKYMPGISVRPCFQTSKCPLGYFIILMIIIIIIK